MKNVQILSLLFLLASCAQMSVPTGGPKDSNAPKLVYSSVELPATNIDPSVPITFTFDEFIKLNNLSKNLTISPSLNPAPVIKSKGKKLFIDLSNCNLDSSKTYSMFFGESIVDNNEQNILSNYSLVFSSGPSIDSMTLTGSVRNAFTGQPVKNASVFLYENTSDTFYKTLPDYIVKSDSSGHYAFKHLPKKVFSYLALLDENGNKLPDNEELIGFSKTTIDFSKPEINGYEMETNRLFKHQKRISATVKDTLISDHYITYVFNKNINKDSLSIYNKRTQPFKTYKIIKDSLRLFYNSKNQYVTIKYSGVELNTDLSFLQPDTTLVHLTLSNQGVTEKDQLCLLSENPINLDQKDSISIYSSDWDKINSSVNQTSPFCISLHSTLKSGKKYHIVCRPQIVERFYSTNTITFLVTPNSSLGNLICKLSNHSDSLENRWLALYKNNQLVIKQPIKQTEVKFTYLKPGAYELYLFIDVNKDREWSTGSLYKKQQPEKIFGFSHSIEIKANWDIEVTVPFQ